MAPSRPRYADNILKGFANSISIILTGLISYLLMSDFILTYFFVMGSLLVMSASFMYGLPPFFNKPAPPADTHV